MVEVPLMATDQATWRIWPELAGATISPLIYGTFAEHLGRCIYDGIWVGPESSIPNEDGFRLDTLNALRDLPTPVVRWPGGCFADDYHWEDGIGPREQRARTRNLWWHGEDSNHFGTDEFIAFCRKIGAEPYICANVGSGTPEEAAGWVEYCNGAADTYYAGLRRGYGNDEPFGVRYWGVGNENWGCGGNMTPEEYAAAFRRFATYMKGRGEDAEMIAVGDHSEGHQGPDWNLRFLEALRLRDNPRISRLIDHLSVHRYFRPLDDVAFTDDQYYQFVDGSLLIEDDIRRTRDLLSYFFGEQKVGIVVDEWGTWYRQARNDNGLEQKSTLLDAVVAAGTLNLFNRWADWVTMANIAQTVNVLQAVIQTEGDRFWLTPTYHAFKLFAPHASGKLVQDELDSPYQELKRPDGSDRMLELLSGSASLAADERTLHLTLVNRHLRNEIECGVSIKGVYWVDECRATVLGGDDVREYNEASMPDRVEPREQTVSPSGDEFVLRLPPHSVTGVSVKLRA
jgi:alpha-L-arabinofuranosidase